MSHYRSILCRIPLVLAGLLGLMACSTMPEGATEMTASDAMVRQDTAQRIAAASTAPDYLIGPYDKLEIFVWRADDLSTQVTVRPDGRISTPLVTDMQAAGKTPSELSTDLAEALSEYVKEPEVTVIVDGFSSTFDQQIRVLGEAKQPQAIPYQAGMTVLDVMLSVGGLTEFAAGNRSRLIRSNGDDQMTYRIRLNDLLRKGDVSANAEVLPGDVILIPETLF